MRLSKLLNEIKPQVIIQLAAVSHANRSNKDPYSTFDHSFRTLENSLKLVKGSTSNVEQFIFFSSSMVYEILKLVGINIPTVNLWGFMELLNMVQEKIIIGCNPNIWFTYNY